MILPDRWKFKDRLLEDFKRSVLAIINGNIDVKNAPMLTANRGTGIAGRLVAWLTTDTIGSADATADDVTDAVAKAHTRAHAITSTSDHSSAAASGIMLKADANGLPVGATNTDAAVSGAVTASHAAATAGTGMGITGQELRLADTAVTPGAYTSADITVDQQGRITVAANGAGGGGGADQSEVIKINWAFGG